MDEGLYSTYSHVLVGIQYFLPLCIISFAYIKIARKLWGSRTPGNAEDTRDAHVLKNKKKVYIINILKYSLQLVFINSIFLFDS